MLDRRSWRSYTFASVCNGSATLSWARADFLHERREPPPASQHGFSDFAWDALRGYDTLVVKPCVDMCMCMHMCMHMYMCRAAAVPTNVPCARTRYGGTHTGGAGQPLPRRLSHAPRAVRALHAY